MSGDGDDFASTYRSSGAPTTTRSAPARSTAPSRTTLTSGPGSAYPPHVFLKRRPGLLRKLVAWKDASNKGDKRRRIQRRVVVPNHMTESQADSQGTPRNKIPDKMWPNVGSANNQIRTTKYTALTFLPKNLFEQFHRFANLYFLFIVLLNWVPQINAFGKEVAMIPVVFVLAVTAIKDAFEDRRRYLSDRRVNNYTCRVYSGYHGRYVKRLWKDVRVGDFIHLSCNEIIPADVLLVRSSDELGLCYIETSNIDGESNLKQMEVVRGYATIGKGFLPSEFTSRIECDMPNNQIYKFNGYILHPDGEKIPVNKENLLLRDCVLKNTDFIEGIVIYAGHETKAMLNNGGPRHKRSMLEKTMNRDVIWCIAILLLLCFAGATGNGVWLSAWDSLNMIPFIPSMESLWNKPSLQGFIGFWTFLIILQVMIPLSLYVTIEIIKLGQVFHIHEDKELYDEQINKRVECRALNIPEDLGQIKYVFSDKTGTLTENNMIFRRCTIGGVDYPHSRCSTAGDQKSSPKIFTKQTDDRAFVLNPRLQEELSQMDIQLRAHPAPTNLQIHLRMESQRIQDFFLLLAVCNTVVVAKRPHKDQMNSSGLYLDSSASNLSSLPSVDFAQDRYTRLQNVDTSSLSSAASTPPPNEGAGDKGMTPRPQRLPVPGFGSRTATPSPTPSPKEIRPFYEAESPDEIALVEAAFRYNCRLLKRTQEAVVLMLPGEGLIEFRLLHVLPFDSVRKRMSVILQHPFTKELILFCKGADSSILPVLKLTNDQEMQRLITKTQYHLNNYSRKGLRILCMAKRILTSEEYAGWLLAHAEAELSLDDRDQKIYHSALRIERELELLGATGIEDRLQDGVPESIAALRAAGIVVWVLTGDKQETAVNIAFSCRLFTMDMEIITLNARSKEAAEETLKFYLDQIDKDLSSDETGSVSSIFSSSSSFFTNYLFGKSGLSRGKSQRRSRRALVVDGRTLAFVLEKSLDQLFLQLAINCSSVLCCRSTPLQKASVVKLVKDRLQVMTLAIGDGANDVSMIQTANVGVGIGGQEGMQAVMASDFVVSRFRFLERLLLVHGHWCYDRLARIILYFFYKNSCFIFVIFWYQFFCGFSGMVMMDQLYLMLFNVLFTSLPPIIIGIYDQDCPDHVLLQNPSLYAQGRRSEIYTKYSFWINLLDAFYQSVMIYFIPHMVYYDTDIGIWEYGTTIYTACILAQLLHVSIETRSWTVLHFLSILFSVAIFFGFAVVYNLVSIGSTTLQNPYFVIQHLMNTADFWFCLVLVCVISCLPRFVIRALQNSLTPSVVTAALQEYKSSKASGQKSVITVAWSRDSSIILRNNSISDETNVRTLQVPTISARLESSMPEVVS